MKQSMNWSTGTPTEIGQHFVAVQVGDEAGWYDFVHWSGENWQCRETETVVAFMTLQELVQQIRIEWPGMQPSISSDDAILSESEFDFKEI